MPKKYKLKGGKSSVSYNVWLSVMAQPIYQQKFSQFLRKCKDYIDTTIVPQINQLGDDDLDGLDRIEDAFCSWASDTFKKTGFGDYSNGLDGNREITDKILNDTDEVHADWRKKVNPSGGKMVRKQQHYQHHHSTQCGMIGRPLHLMNETLSGGTLTGGNIIDDWISKLGTTFGNIGTKIGNFVNENQDLFVTILVDLLMVVVAPEISIVDFAGSIASVATTIAKYSMNGPPAQQISEDDANSSLYILMADPRWNDDLVQPTIDYCKIILGYILNDPAPCRSNGANKTMTFDIHGLFKEWSGLVGTSSYSTKDGAPLNGRQASGIIVVGYANATNKTLTHPIIFDPSIENNYEMKIWSANGFEWRKGQSADAAIATLWANYDNWEERLLALQMKGLSNDPVAKANSQKATMYFFGPPQSPFQLHNGADIYPIMDGLIANLPPLGVYVPPTPTPLVPAPPKPTTSQGWLEYLQKYGTSVYPPPGTYDPNAPTTPTTPEKVPAPPRPTTSLGWLEYLQKYGTSVYPPPGTYVDDY